jgi:hypothetical protein
VLHFQFHGVWIKRSVASFVAGCTACQKVKAALPVPLPLQPLVIYGSLPHVHMDLTGPFMTPAEDQLMSPTQQLPAVKNCRVITEDYFTKVAESVPIAVKEPFIIWDQWICSYGVPLAVTTNNANECKVDFAHMSSR